MRQRGTVEAAWDDTAIISVRRESACSGDCHKCAGCGAVTQTLQIRARNLIGARKGDKVYFESASNVRRPNFSSASPPPKPDHRRNCR